MNPVKGQKWGKVEGLVMVATLLWPVVIVVMIVGMAN